MKKRLFLKPRRKRGKVGKWGVIANKIGLDNKGAKSGNFVAKVLISKWLLYM
jgi:hypothetical protein